MYIMVGGGTGGDFLFCANVAILRRAAKESESLEAIPPPPDQTDPTTQTKTCHF